MPEDCTELRRDHNELDVQFQSFRKALIAAGSVALFMVLTVCGITIWDIKGAADKLIYAYINDVLKPQSATILNELKTTSSEASKILQTLKDEAGEKVVARRETVFAFTHPENSYPAGEEWAERYYHIRTPVKVRSEEMWRYDLTGYSYGIGRPLSMTWVGYTYRDGATIRHDHAVDNTENEIAVSQYFGLDGVLYLKFGPISQYHNSFVLDFQSGSSGERIEHHDGYRAILTKDDIQIQ